MQITKRLSCVGLVLVVIGEPVFPQQAGSQPTVLEGTWLGEKSMTSGATRAFKPGEVKMVFKGDKLLATGIVSPDERPLVFKINTAVTPHEFDYFPTAQDPMHCIFEIRDDTLTIATPRGPGGPRPAQFQPESKTMVILVLKQSK